MTWQGPRSKGGASNPGYHTKGWLHIKEYWRTQRLPCARCGCAIDYDGPYKIIVRGKQMINPRYLVVGHKVSVALAQSLGMTTAQTFDVSNTQPECWDCSKRSGARSGNHRQRLTRR